MSDLALRTENLYVSLGGNPVLNGISFQLAQGEAVALLGANGSGKSTLVRTSLGIYPKTRGHIELFGVPLGHKVPWRRIGYVPQRNPGAGAIPTNVEEVVRSGGLAGRSLRLASRRAAFKALDSLGVLDLARRPFGKLSGGQQQRVLVARALVREPDLLVMDEPTTGMDLPSIEALVKAVAEHRTLGGTVLIVLHGLGAFEKVLDRSVVLDGGRIVRPSAQPPELHHEHTSAADDATWGLRTDRSVT